MNMDAEIFACQLTKIEGDLFRSLTIEELYSGSWNKSDAALRTPNIHCMTMHCNRVSQFLTTFKLANFNRLILDEQLGGRWINFESHP